MNKKVLVLIITIVIIAIGAGIFYYFNQSQKNETVQNSNQDNGALNNSASKNENNSTNSTDISHYSGFIIEVGENYIIVNNKEKNETQTFYADENNEFLNSRTNQKINISQVKIGDYYQNWDKSIVRNITGEELKKELLLNMAANDYYYVANDVAQFINVENKGDYVIYTLEMADTASSVFLDNDQECPNFTISFIANGNTKVYGHYNETIYNFEEYAKGNLVTIRIDSSTVDDQYPIITSMEYYDG